MSGHNIFATSVERLDRWLDITGGSRVVFGHNPHRSSRPEVYHDGKAINFDGGFSRQHRLNRRLSPAGATVAPLPPPADQTLSARHARGHDKRAIPGRARAGCA